MKPTLVSLTVSEVLALRSKSQSFQAEGRTPSSDKEKTTAIAEAFNYAKEQGLEWPIGMEQFKIAKVEGEIRLLGGFHRCIGINSSSFKKEDSFSVVDYGEISMAEAIQLAGADNLHLGKQESPLQRTARVQAIVANGGDLDESLKVLNLSKSSFNQYVSTLKNLNVQVRKALMKGELTDGQAKAVNWLIDAEEEKRDVKTLIADGINAPKTKGEIEAKRKAPESTPKTPESTPKTPESTPKAPESTPKAPESTPKAPESTPKAPESTPKAPESTPKAPEKALEPKRFLTVADRINHLKEALGNHFNDCPRDARSRFVEELVDYLADLQG